MADGEAGGMIALPSRHFANRLVITLGEL